MTYQNRVDPLGELFAPDSTAIRGAWTGNRGRLHAPGGRIMRRYELKRWIYCRLDYARPSHRVMAPGRWTHLFFLDEATALAAGHRPCAFCLNPRFKTFQSAWARGLAPHLGLPDLTAPESGFSAPAIDSILHAERLTKSGEKAVYRETLNRLPDGCFILIGDDPAPYLVLGDVLFGWTPSGYLPPRPRPHDIAVTVMTPASTVQALKAGFSPTLHPSASL